eukprot:Gb_34742 [translate_table: standard]
MKLNEDDERQSTLHAVVIPVPAQGHINPLMNLAKLLASRGFFITFINTDWIENRIFRKPDDTASVSARLLQQGLKFRFLSIPDGLPPEHGPLNNPTELFQAMHKMRPPMEHLLRNVHIYADGFPPITCILTDRLMSCTVEVASNLGVPRVVFWPDCAATSIAQCNSRLLLSKGYIPVNAKEAKSPEKLITCLPGRIPPFKADYVLVNSFEELEGKEAIKELCNGYPALAIGPVFLPNFLEGRGSGTSMWEEDPKCLQWLDMQKPASVLYVSFGSVAMKSQEQLQQLALGLEASQRPFLWVIRSDIAEGESMVLPEGFVDRTKDRALLVGWAPQVKVLSHPSVGGFLTHNGWNSTLESISMGVPMIGWPYFGDQFLNCRFAKEIWKVGMDFEGVEQDDQMLVSKEEVEKVVRDLMEGKQGKELRENAGKLKEAASKEVMAGGSSFHNLDMFTKDMTEKVGSMNERPR